MQSSLESLVWRRAKQTCEYCQLPQDCHPSRFEIDHVIAIKHGGKTLASNLALACFSCNSYKGPNIAGIDPQTGEIVRLFHPRRELWSAHFHWAGARLIGDTEIGRATINVLEINHPDHIALREELISEGVFPPTSD